MQVVVTGIGLVSALGQGRSLTWDRMLAGDSGLQRHSPFPHHQNLLLGLLGSVPQSIERLIQESLNEALSDANLGQVPETAGVVLGSSRGNQSEIEAIACHAHPHQDWQEVFQTSPSAVAARYLKTTGPILAPRAACATGLWAIAQGADLIRHGFADVVIAGGAEAPITPLTIAGFQKMGALSDRGSAPFDLNRSGFILGEGAAIFILESRRHAQARNQTIYGSVLGFGSSADAYHISAPHPDSQTAINAVHACLSRSSLDGKDVAFIHTHGTGTQLNDVNEAHIIQTLCPQAPPCTSSKGAIGHTLGASGAFGSAICLLGIKHRVFPPCTGLQKLDPACDLNLLRRAQSLEISNALCLSFGFGGQNAAIAFSRIND